MRAFTKLTLLTTFILICTQIKAQTVYKMRNGQVTECEGILTDSENSRDQNFPTGYDTYEDYCFTICVPNSPKITITFSEFKLEVPGPNETVDPNADFLEIFDGPNCTGTKLGHWYSNLSPGTISGTGSCISIRFRSDGNKSSEGFSLSWQATPPPPDPPVIQPIANQNCNSTSLVIQFDRPIPCNQVTTGNFTFSGPSSGIASATPFNCVNGMTTAAILNFSGPLNESGTYCINFDLNYTDICKKTYRFSVPACFNIINCPLRVDLLGDSVICLGSCANLRAVARGGNPATYQYSWTPNTTDVTANVTVCPTTTTTYRVTVTDGNSTPVSATRLVTVLPVPDAGDTAFLCRFAMDTVFTGTPAGGRWSGPGIVDLGGGNYVFRAQNAGAGVHTVYYTDLTTGCRDPKIVVVWQASAGGRRAACAGTPPFQLFGNPNPGSWTGPNTTPDGVFDPVTPGIYTVSYTDSIHFCTASQVVEVVDSIIVPDTGLLSVCDKQAPFQLSFSPRGGQWSGTGISDQYNGWFNPAAAPPGTYILKYSLNGCADSTNITVTSINAGPDVLICPVAAPQLITAGAPAKGFWSGNGVVDNGDTTFTFNPTGVTPNTTFTQTYTKDGCTDSRIVYFYFTTVTPDTFEFCNYAGKFFLDPALTTPNPPGGVWTGVGLSAGDSINPKVLNPGYHYFRYQYNSNGCYDTLVVLIKPKPNAGPDIDTCPKANNFIINGNPKPGVWTGPGILDTVSGEFSPAQAGFGADGIFTIYYNVQGCMDTMQVTLTTVDPSFTGLRPYYCLNNTVNPLVGVPAGGTFIGPGISGNNFHPDSAGTGVHKIVYTYGNADCAVRDSQYVRVLSPLKLELVYDTTRLCYGDSVRVNTIYSGGDSTRTYHFAWTPSSPDRRWSTLRPTSFTPFTCTLTDGCSVPVTASGQIDVWPEIKWITVVGPPVCFGEMNWGKVVPQTIPESDFDVHWFTNPPFDGDSVFTVAEKYDVTITNRVSHCFKKFRVGIPYYNIVDANFIKDPLDMCVPVDNPHFEFINTSTGADRGYWTFGEGDSIPYDPLLNPGHTYSDTGSYHIKLYIENEGGCKDSVETDVCVYPIKQYAMPNAFTPDGNGDNDVFPMGSWVNGKWLPTGYGLTDYEMKVFDRWGHLLYETDAARTPWNGKLKNMYELQKNGVYVYTMTVYFGPRDIREFTGHITLVR